MYREHPTQKGADEMNRETPASHPDCDVVVPLYRSREEKAANLLYFVVKDRPFTDGNKRIGSLPFLSYLKQEGVEHGLNPQALTALTLLIAESAPAAKGLMIRLVVNLLSGPAG